MGSLSLSKKSKMVYSLIWNFRITKSGITWEIHRESHRNVSCAARVCQAGKGCRRKLELHLLPLCKLLLTLMLKHWHPQLRLANSPLCNGRWHKKLMYWFSFMLFSVLSWFSFSDELVLLCICIIRKLCGHTKGKVLRQGRDTTCWNNHFGSTSKATNWLFLSPLSFSCVLEINHSLMFLK